MKPEEVLKEILRGEPQLSPELLRETTRPGNPIGPALVALIRNIRLWHTDVAGLWATLHAIRLVSGRHIKDATPALVDAIFLASSTRHEDAMDDLPIALAQEGPQAQGLLISVLEDQRLEGTIRLVAAAALEGLAVLHPDTQDEILGAFRKIISSNEEPSGLRGHLITSLAHFRLPDDARLIKHTTRAMPMMSDLETDDIDEYFRQSEEPEAWSAFRSNLLDYYQS